MQTENNTIFTTSFHEINRELNLRVDKIRDTGEDMEEIYSKLPKFLKKGNFFVEGFSRAASDTLPPHQSYDHKIELTSDHTLGYEPLYSQTQDELVALKKYILENLDKGFIEPSQTAFFSPILCVKNVRLHGSRAQASRNSFRLYF